LQLNVTVFFIVQKNIFLKLSEDIYDYIMVSRETKKHKTKFLKEDYNEYSFMIKCRK